MQGKARVFGAIAAVAAAVAIFPAAEAAAAVPGPTITSNGQYATYIGTSGNDKVWLSSGPRFYVPHGTPVNVAAGCSFRQTIDDRFDGPRDIYLCSAPTLNHVTFLLGDGNDTLESLAQPSAGGLSWLSHPVKVLAGAGNDNVRTPDYNDVIDLGPGRDTTWSRAGNDYIEGGDGADKISAGGDEPDTDVVLDHGTSTDRIGLNDKAWGGDGNDYFDLGVGTDRIEGGEGDDAVQARDGYRDVIKCQEGSDRAQIDTTSGDLTIVLDRPKGCETVGSQLGLPLL